MQMEHYTRWPIVIVLLKHSYDYRYQLLILIDFDRVNFVNPKYLRMWYWHCITIKCFFFSRALYSNCSHVRTVFLYQMLVWEKIMVELNLFILINFKGHIMFCSVWILIGKFPHRRKYVSLICKQHMRETLF